MLTCRNSPKARPMSRYFRSGEGLQRHSKTSLLHPSCVTLDVSVFTALHVMRTRSSDENSVCLSVCPSNAWIVTKRKKISPDFYIQYERSFILVFWEKEWLVGATHSTWNLGSTGPRWSEIADFQQIIARSASAVTPSEKSSINTLVGVRCWNWDTFFKVPELRYFCK